MAILLTIERGETLLPRMAILPTSGMYPFSPLPFMGEGLGERAGRTDWRGDLRKASSGLKWLKNVIFIGLLR